MTGSKITRRHLIATSVLGGASLAAGYAFGRSIHGVPWVAGQAPVPRSYPDARFFTEAERRCVDALVARLIPSDDSGPGAREAGVAEFIDSQLAGSYGRGERWYMRPPFREGTEQQGYQSEHAPAQLYRTAIASLDGYCRDRFDGQDFAGIPEAEQDAILKRIEDGELELDGVPAAAFFGLLRANTIEGFFCDPIYGGNRDMVGWKLVGFPGARYDYRDFLDHGGKAISLEPVGLGGRPAWSVD